jgi:hypothetical protein
MPRSLAASTRPWPAMICLASSIKTGLQNPNFLMLLAICRICRFECVRALLGYPAHDVLADRTTEQRTPCLTPRSNGVHTIPPVLKDSTRLSSPHRHADQHSHQFDLEPTRPVIAPPAMARCTCLLWRVHHRLAVLPEPQRNQNRSAVELLLPCGLAA